MKKLNDISIVMMTNKVRKLDFPMFYESILIVDDSGCDFIEDNKHTYYNSFIDFSSQRNFAISKVNTEKVMFIDDDEELVISNLNKFVDSLKTISHNTVMYFEYIEKGFTERGTTNTRVLLKKHVYEGYVHENIYEGIDKYIKIEGAYLVHEGYSEEKLYLKKYRNLKLLYYEYLIRKNSKFNYYYLKDSFCYFTINFDMLAIVEPENYYLEFLMFLLFELPESSSKTEYIEKLNKEEEILKTLLFVKYNIGEPNYQVLDYLKINNIFSLTSSSTSN